MTFRPTHLLSTVVTAACVSLSGERAVAVEYTAPLRLGLYDLAESGEFTRDDGFQSSALAPSNTAFLASGGYLAGASNRYNGSTQIGTALWVGNVATGQTWRVGLYDPIGSGGTTYTSSDGTQSGRVFVVTSSGLAVGRTDLYLGTGARTGYATFITDTATGVTTRTGLFGVEFTSSTGVQNGDLQGTNLLGYHSGFAVRYNGGATQLGQAAWVASPEGVTTRIGLWDATSATNEFTSSTGAQTTTSPATDLSSSWLYGIATRYNGGASAVGGAAWISNLAGTTYRVGLWDATSATNEFTHTNGTQTSTIFAPNAAGWAYGVSNRYNGGSTQLGTAAYIANGTTGISTRVGFYDASGTGRYTSSAGAQNSTVVAILNSGLFAGQSTIYVSGTGFDAWLGSAADPSALQRLGFTDAAYTSSAGLQYSQVVSLTDSWVAGASRRYSGTTDLGAVGWVASTSNVSDLKAIGLNGGTFVSTSGVSNATVIAVTESGWVQGTSQIYYNTNAVGNAPWVANAQTGVTTRVGLFNGEGGAPGNEFTNSSFNSQSSTVPTTGKITEAGYLYGSSNRYNGGSEQIGSAAWAAKASTGETFRLGLWDADGTGIYTSLNGTQTSTTSGMTGAGLLWGTSNRYIEGTSTANGKTSWIFDLTSETQITFELSVRASDGYANSLVNGITSDGLAYGTFDLYDPTTSASLGARAFLWSEEIGTVVLDEAISDGVAQYGWSYLSTAGLANADGFYAGLGTLADGSGQGVFAAQVVPEPSTFTVLSLGLGLLGLCRFRRSSTRGHRNRWPASTP